MLSIWSFAQGYHKYANECQFFWQQKVSVSPLGGNQSSYLLSPLTAVDNADAGSSSCLSRNRHLRCYCVHTYTWTRQCLLFRRFSAACLLVDAAAFCVYKTSKLIQVSCDCCRNNFFLILSTSKVRTGKLSHLFRYFEIIFFLYFKNVCKHFTKQKHPLYLRQNA